MTPAIYRFQALGWPIAAAVGTAVLAVAVAGFLEALYVPRTDDPAHIHAECAVAGEIAAVIARTRDLGEPIIKEPEVSFSPQLAGSPYDNGFPAGRNWTWTPISTEWLYATPRPIDCSQDFANRRIVLAQLPLKAPTEFGPERYALSRVSMSPNGDTVTVRVSMTCGSVCGFGWRTVWRRQNGQWTLIGKDMLWIS